MRKIVKIFLNDIKNICKRPVAVIVMLGLLFIPGIYAWLNIDSNWNPYENTKYLPIAVVNKDKGTTILGKEVNMGSMVKSSLEKNNDMGWRFNSEKEAEKLVRSSEYYGLLEIPENFSAKLLESINSKKIDKPTLNMTINHKKNPIAPIIAKKAADAVQLAINQNVVNKIIYNALEKASDFNLLTKFAKSSEELIERLEQAKDGIDDVKAIFKTVELATDSTCSTLNAFRDLIPTVDSLTGTTTDGINDMRNAIKSFGNLSNNIHEIIYSMVDDGKEAINIVDSIDLSGEKELVSKNLDILDERLTRNAEKIQKAKDTLNRINKNLPIPTSGRIQKKLDGILKNIDEIQGTIRNRREDIQDKKKELNDIKRKLKNLQKKQRETYDDYQKSIRVDLDSAQNNASKSMDSITSLMAGVSKTAKQSDTALKHMIDALSNTKELNDNLDTVFSKIQKDIDAIKNTMSGKKESEIYDKFIKLMEKNPVDVADFISKPVETKQIAMYEIESYGAKMAPFYTVLACWVGCTILISIIKTDITETMETKKLRNYQKFLGRFMLFAIMAMVQGLIIGIGDLILKIKVTKQPLFLFGIVLSSFVFMLFIYSMTVSFGKVGEALSIVIMVFQVAGSGGTFPIELLPRTFQVLQPIMPFYPAMNMLRETIGGFYENSYVYYMIMLLGHTIIPLLLGLLFRNPIIHVKEKMERELERTELVI